MDEGVVAGTRAIVAIVAGEKLPLPERTARPRASPWLVLLWIVLVLGVLIARSLSSRRRSASGDTAYGSFRGGSYGRSGVSGAAGSPGAAAGFRGRRRLRRRWRIGELVMRIEELLDQRGFAAIEEAVAAAERTTSGEIVPILVERSDPYAEARFGAAA